MVEAQYRGFQIKDLDQFIKDSISLKNDKNL